jgi:two-component system chemotaxis response regulator CheB
MITPKVSPSNGQVDARGKIRVLIVDDSPTARAAIAAILDSDPEIQIVGQAVDGEEGVALAAQLKPDVITMDITMPKLNGYEATKQIMAHHPTPIVVVSRV